MCVPAHTLSHTFIERVRVILLRFHEAGVAHLDFHEQNVCVVFVEERVRAQIIDFGLVELVANPLQARRHWRLRRVRQGYQVAPLD